MRDHLALFVVRDRVAGGQNAGSGYAALSVVVALALYGFRTSLGGRRLFELADV